MCNIEIIESLIKVDIAQNLHFVIKKGGSMKESKTKALEYIYLKQLISLRKR